MSDLDKLKMGMSIYDMSIMEMSNPEISKKEKSIM
jgi:hypothetical protein